LLLVGECWWQLGKLSAPDAQEHSGKFAKFQQGTITIFLCVPCTNHMPPTAYAEALWLMAVPAMFKDCPDMPFAKITHILAPSKAWGINCSAGGQ
jgi:hypothetical protein